MVDWNFEGAFSQQDGIPQIQAPEGWRGWWVEGNPLDEPGVTGHFRPEMGPISAAAYPYRVKAGSQAVKIHKMYGTYHAGLLARVDAVAGREYTFSAFAQIWTGATEGSPPISEGDPYNFAVSVGIDPTGGEDPLSDTVVWCDEVGQAAWDAYVPLQIRAVARAAHVTVFVRCRCKWRVKHNDSYWDVALLTASGGADPEPTPGEGFDWERLAASSEAIACGYLAAARILRGEEP